MSQDRIIIRQPDDWHLHLRDGDVMRSVVVPTSRVFRRAVVMPNLQPPITSVQSAIDYRQRILSAVPKGDLFTPLMTAYLTDNLSTEVLRNGFEAGVFFAAKLYPAYSMSLQA